MIAHLKIPEDASFIYYFSFLVIGFCCSWIRIGNLLLILFWGVGSRDLGVFGPVLNHIRFGYFPRMDGELGKKDRNQYQA